MWDFIGKFFEAVLDWIATFFDFIIEWIFAELLVPNIFNNVTLGTSIYNGIIGDSIYMLTINPSQWNAEGWNFIVTEVYPIFLMIACPLVVIFYLIGFCAESIDPKMHGEVRLETILLGFFKLSIAEFVTVYALDIVCALFSFVDFLTGGWVGENAKISSELEFALEEVSSLPGLALLGTYLTSLIYMVVLILVACIILYKASIRFFKILALIPLGTLASATIAGTRELNHTAMHFWKFVISVILESVVMLLMLALFARIQNSFQVITLDGEIKMIGCFLNRILLAFLCLGSVNSASTLLQKALGV